MSPQTPGSEDPDAKPDDLPTSDEAYVAALRDACGGLPKTEDLGEEESFAADLVRAHFDAHRPEAYAFPRVAMRLIDLVQLPQVDIHDLVREIELDASVAGGLLALANSAARRALDPVETIQQAVTRLGISEVARVAAAIAVRALFRRQAQAELGSFGPVWPVLFLHAVVTGRLAAELARGRRGVAPDVVFMAGLLHDVGQVVAMQSLAALTLDKSLPPRSPESAFRILHEVHQRLGAEVHRTWSLPASLAVAAARHHEPDLPVQAELVPVHLVRLASAVDLLRSAPAAHPGAVQEIVQSARALGISPARLGRTVRAQALAADWARVSVGELQLKAG